jgi:hypothetical protein
MTRSFPLARLHLQYSVVHRSLHAIGTDIYGRPAMPQFSRILQDWGVPMPGSRRNCNLPAMLFGCLTYL